MQKPAGTACAKAGDGTCAKAGKGQASTASCPLQSGGGQAQSACTKAADGTCTKAGKDQASTVSCPLQSGGAQAQSACAKAADGTCTKVDCPCRKADETSAKGSSACPLQTGAACPTPGTVTEPPAKAAPGGRI